MTDATDSSRLFSGIVSQSDLGVNARKRRGRHAHYVITAVGLAKDAFELTIARRAGHRLVQHRLSPQQFQYFFAQGSPVNMGIEDRGTEHYRARELGALGHAVRLLPTQYVHARCRCN